MIHYAKDLSLDQKAVIEGLLGRRMLENEAIGILAIEPPVASRSEAPGTNGGTEEILLRSGCPP